MSVSVLFWIDLNVVKIISEFWIKFIDVPPINFGQKTLMDLITSDTIINALLGASYVLSCPLTFVLSPR